MNNAESNSRGLTTEFEAALQTVLEKNLAFAPGTPPNLADAIRYSLLSGGKRIRPRLVQACAGMIGLQREAALPAAIALEMIHCFTLIHDDLPCMDNDDFRRGKASNHRVYGEALALLAGDALVPLAFEVLAEAAVHVNPAAFQHALKRFCWASGPRGVIGGQSAEMLMNEKSTFEDLRKMHGGKTGALFAAALLLPADLAGIDEKSPRGRAIHDFAFELGFAFQVADDISDAEQDKGRPTTILAYMNEAAARELAETALTRVSRELSTAWGKTAAQPLLDIAEQVRNSFAGHAK